MKIMPTENESPVAPLCDVMLFRRKSPQCEKVSLFSSFFTFLINDVLRFCVPSAFEHISVQSKKNLLLLVKNSSLMKDS